MPSRPDLAMMLGRQLRLVGIGAVVVLGIALVLEERPASGESLDATSRTLDAVLRQATTEPATHVSLRATALPSAAERDWLRALRLAGTTVTWRSEGALPRSVLSVEPSSEPDGSQAISVLGEPGMSVRLRDGGGALDSLVVGPSGVLVRSGIGGREVQAIVGPGASMTASPDAVVRRPVLILGRAGWETKFTIAALEESGWPVDARLTVAPGVVVSVGSPAALDTARYVAAVVLDTGLVRNATLEAYARAGGGVVVAGDATADASLIALAGASLGERRRPELGALVGNTPLDGLGARVLLPRDSLAAVLSRRGDAGIAVARRLGLGRVIALGLEDTWRWRLEGSDGSVAAHRQWWSMAVSQAAYLPVVTTSVTNGLDGAPYVATRAALGPPTPTAAPERDWWRWLVPLLFAMALVSLLAEWALRRIQGER